MVNIYRPEKRPLKSEIPDTLGLAGMLNAKVRRNGIKIIKKDGMLYIRDTNEEDHRNQEGEVGCRLSLLS